MCSRKALTEQPYPEDKRDLPSQAEEICVRNSWLSGNYKALSTHRHKERHLPPNAGLSSLSVSRWAVTQTRAATRQQPAFTIPPGDGQPLAEGKQR